MNIYLVPKIQYDAKAILRDSEEALKVDPAVHVDDSDYYYFPRHFDSLKMILEQFHDPTILGVPMLIKSPPHSKILKHIDYGYGLRHISINFPLNENSDNMTTGVYKFDRERTDADLDIRTYVKDCSSLIAHVNYKCPIMLATKLPHNVHNATNQTRLTLSWSLQTNLRFIDVVSQYHQGKLIK